MHQLCLYEGLLGGDNDVTLYTSHLYLCEGLLGGDNDMTLYPAVCLYVNVFF